MLVITIIIVIICLTYNIEKPSSTQEVYISLQSQDAHFYSIQKKSKTQARDLQVSPNKTFEENQLDIVNYIDVNPSSKHRTTVYQFMISRDCPHITNFPSASTKS